MPKKKKPAPKPAARRPVKPAAKAKPVVKPAAKKPVAAPAPVAAGVPTVPAFRDAILRHLKSTFARDPITATKNDWWLATCMAARDLMLERYIATQSVHASKNVRRVYYLSLEYLMGRVLSNNLVNLGLRDVAGAALKSLGQDLEAVTEEEADMGLGNGGLGRLAACFLDSLATMDIPAIGYGIHYEFGLFRQTFVQGRQVEVADAWLANNNPWLIRRPNFRVRVPLYGRVQHNVDDRGNHRAELVDTRDLVGVPWDIPIAGFAASSVNFLRLWESKATTEFDFRAFDRGGYVEAVRERDSSETISKVLYPNDSTESGKELRLVQQIFFVSCSLQDILRRHLRLNPDFSNLPDKVAIQLNDTHPSISVAEMMRLLIDVERLNWDEAWSLCTRVFSYTNHTLLPEALETWSVPLFEKVLPRHLEIIYEINRRHLREVDDRWPGDDEKKAELSIIQEGSVKRVRMAHLAVVGSHHVNGVAELHTRLLRAHLFPSFDALWPDKFVNVTNGVTPRRWIRGCNQPLAALCDEVAGKGWEKQLSKLRALDALADKPAFQDRFLAIKHANKVKLAARIRELVGVEVSPDALFDVQIKRLHEYKRQHLNLLHILHLYRKILNNPGASVQPRVCIFGAKAAPGYALAKHIIHAINRIGSVINNDPRVRGLLKVVFLPDYRVSLAEQIIPAADLSEQISTAGKEASGTGNMKLALNGAVTIGTLDGANVEIHEEVGDENIFIFGLQVEEVAELYARGYSPEAVLQSDPELAALLDWLRSDAFTPEQPGALSPVADSLVAGGDPYLVLADFRSYVEAQGRAEQAFANRRRWAAMAIRNVARCAKFSSDRSIADYAKHIWQAKSQSIPR
ncbi:MAG: glycogen/starch/alpha-glucan phosphorylase [Verrucomicrobia bacterium]|jgi:glycogen phosphorylase|nr:glycogen/starch/alpha-glucan phosphorylase [Verrucomicrobiota bacterium]